MADNLVLPPDDQRARSDAFLQRHAIAANLFSQAVDRSLLFAIGAGEDAVSAHWSGHGARNIGGRIRALAQHPDNPLVLYAGSAAGGVFKSADGGDTWAALGGPQAVFSVAALAIAPSDPSVLYIGTGEQVTRHGVSGAAVVAGAVFGSYPSGRGFFRFREGAALGAAEVGPVANSPPGTPGAADSFARIAVDPSDAERCWMATHTGLWRREAGPVFHREPVPAAMPAAPALGAAATDVIVVQGWDPDRPKLLRLYAAIGGQGIYRGVFNRDLPGSDTVWEPILGVGLPAPCTPVALTWDRIRLTVCSNQPDHLYAIAENANNGAVLAVYHSSNAGNSWTARALPLALLGAAAWYSLFIEVHPENPAIVVMGELNVLRSSDFGQNWEQILDWTSFDAGDHAQHADEHNALFDCADPRRFWLANDGGLSVAQDIVSGHPLRDRGWRKRSHGISAAMFNDITVHPTYPQMMGGGLQDNGTYISFGGETWFSVWGGDGGQMCFEVATPRVFVAPTQGSGAGSAGPGALVRSSVSTVSAVFTGSRAPLVADRDPPFDVFATQARVIEAGINVPLHGALFVPVIEHHPSAPNRLLVGRQNGGAYQSIDGGDNWTVLAFDAAATAAIGGASISALGFGIQAAANADFWIGGNNGVLILGINNPPAATVWRTFALAAAAGHSITRVAVHPEDDRYVAFCTASPAAGQQGRVFLSADRGAHWSDISNLTGAGAAQPGSVPPGPCTSLAFDPQPAAAVAQTLFVGALAGVFVVRNLPRRSPPAGAALPVFVPLWARFSGIPSGNADGPAALPMILVEDLKTVVLPARAEPDVVANEAETVRRTRLMAATFGRGMYACDITRVQAVGVPVGGPPIRLYLRQTVIEDGLSYPRPTPVMLNQAPLAASPFRFGGDPRFPLNALRFTDHEAFDIRIDNPPFQFFDDVVDGVEFDETLATKPVLAGARNVVYVQVHSCGWSRVVSATVHLYFAASPAPAGNPNAAPLPDLHADFWAHWLDAPLPAPAVAPVGNAAAWQRAGVPVHLNAIGPNQPEVARIDWLAPATLPAFVALLAVVTSPLGVDPLLPAGQPTVMATLLRRERRAAFRVAPVTPFVPDLFIRDGLDDTGRLGGVAFGGRSPDIIVVPAALVDLAGTTLDLANPRSADRVLPGPADNFIYVRVQNRSSVATPVDVELFWAKSNPALSAAADAAGPVTDNTKWQAAVGLGPVANVLVPAKGAVLVGFKLGHVPAAAAGLANSLAFIALIKASGAGDAKPLRTRVTDAASLWRFFLQLADANNAALRTVRYA
jgi:hypothetical protein